MSDTEKDFDYGDDGVTTPKSGDNSMGALANLAKQQVEAELAVEKAQEALKAAQDKLRQVSEFDLPELMAELGLESFATDTGFRIDIAESIHASIANKHQEEAMDWFDSSGNSGVVKREFKINFTKDETKFANKFKADLARRKRPLNALITRTVHASTLKSFVKERLEAGEEVPQELLGVHRRRISKVKAKV